MQTKVGEVVVITGASAGVGRATARAFARRGARIGLIARGKEGLEATQEEVQRLGGEALALPADVADPAQVEAAADAVESTLGAIDIWVNNAMVSVFAEFVDVEPDEYRRVTDVVYHGSVYGTRSALRRMLPRNRGTIVLVGSALAYRGIPLQAAYCGSKHAVKGMFESVRSELLHHGSKVHLSMVQLPALNTPQFEWSRSKLPRKSQPVPPIYQPEIAAEAIVWAAYHRRREIYAGFPAVRTIIGSKLFSGIADRFLARTGYDSQMRDEPADPASPDNLWEPIRGDQGAHGAFDARSRDRAPALWASKHKGWLGLTAGLLAGIAAAALTNTRR